MIEHFKKIDYKLLISIMILSIFGVVMIYSASSYSAKMNYNDGFYFAKKQLISLFVGFFVMMLVSKLKIKYLIKFRWVIVVVSLVLLALVFIPGLGIENYGAKRWINLGFTTFQPSEIAKFGMVIFMAYYLSNHDMTKFKNCIPILLTGLCFCGLIIIEPNMSITMCVGMVMLILLFISGMKIKHFILMALPIAVVIPVLIIIEPYRMQRLMAFVDPWASPKGEGYQLIQSYYALGSGGLFGLGLFRSRQKHLFLPFSESDFIFAIIGEELGLVGATLLMLLCMYIIYRGIVIAVNAEDRYKGILASGVTAVFATQTMLNIAVVIGAIPPTGLPMPFISAGGSSLVSFMGAFGILLNISKGRPSTLSQIKP